MIDKDINKKISQYYSFKKILGRGNFGSVYLVENINDQTYAACKVINKDKIKEIPKLRQLINNQIMVLYNCQDKNIVNYLASFQDEYYIYIVMQYCNGGDLDQYIQTKGGKLFEQQAKFILKQIINGFKSIKKINAIHRDFKPENILISNGVIKIADLGFSKILTPHQDKTHTVLGTLFTMAPQIISKSPYSCQCDIWSIGIVYYKLLYGTYPYTGRNYAQMLKKIMTIKLQFNSQIQVSQQSKDFILRCLIVEPKKRITWQEIQFHRIIAPKIILPSLKIPQDVVRIQQFYIKNCRILQIKNFIDNFDVKQLYQKITLELNEDLQKKDIEKRFYSYYSMVYMAVRQYVFLRVKFGLRLIEKMICLNQIKTFLTLQQHTLIGYIVAQQTLRQICDIIESLNKKQDIFKFSFMINQFFESQEYILLKKLFSNDRQTVINYVTKFKDQMSKNDLRKLWVSYVNTSNKTLLRERRYIVQYSIQLFNSIDKFDRKTGLMILILIQFLIDQVEQNYKNHKTYAQLQLSFNLKEILSNTKHILSRLKNVFQ